MPLDVLRCLEACSIVFVDLFNKMFLSHPSRDELRKIYDWGSQFFACEWCSIRLKDCSLSIFRFVLSLSLLPDCLGKWLDKERFQVPERIRAKSRCYRNRRQSSTEQTLRQSFARLVTTSLIHIFLNGALVIWFVSRKKHAHDLLRVPYTERQAFDLIGRLGVGLISSDFWEKWVMMDGDPLIDLECYIYLFLYESWDGLERYIKGWITV